jgi:hypothetical protein
LRYDPDALNLQYLRFVESAGCPVEGAFECLQNRSPRVLQRANQRETNRAEWGKFVFGPAIDGIYVRDLPGRELLYGNHVKNITILQGHNEYVHGSDDTDIREEGLIFVDPRLIMASERQTRTMLHKNLPFASLSTLQKIGNMYLSPSRSNGEYAHQFDRVNALISGFTISLPN